MRDDYERDPVSPCGCSITQKPYRKTDRVILDPPLLIVEVLSPDDRTQDTNQRAFWL